MKIEVDDDFEIKVKPMEVPKTYVHLVGDRWSKREDHNVDARRNSNVVEHGAKPDPTKVLYLNYTNSIMFNCNLIKNSTKPFITTFTGIGIIADLMNKETIVCWDEDMRTWDGHSVEFDFERHYYTDRKAKLVHVKDLAL
jgi:hypothetical protein